LSENKQKKSALSSNATTGQNQTPKQEPANLFQNVDWFNVPARKNKWLVDGLLLRSGSSLLVGKPKAGKYTVAKNIVVAVLKGRQVLGRSVSASAKPKVIYLALEGKDRDVASHAEQFRALGVTEDEAARLRVYMRDASGSMAERVQWLIQELKTFPADLVVVDTLRLFTGKAVKDTNSYDETVEAMDNLETPLRKSEWAGQLMCVHHGRKDDEKKNQMLDSCLGSSGLTAAVNCIILVSHPDDDEPLRIISSKQNETDKLLGDMVKTELLLDPDTYIVTLGRTLKAIQAQQANKKVADLRQRVADFVTKNPGCDFKAIKEGVTGREQNIRAELNFFLGLGIVKQNGEGKKNDPATFSVNKEEKAA
jgi:hypothetical protein